MEIIQVRTQDELDAALKDPNKWPELVGGGEFNIYDSAQVRAYGSAQVRAYGSAQVRAYGSAQVAASDSAQVTAYGSAQVRASKHVAVTKHGDNTNVAGGVQIQYESPANLQEWLEEYQVEVNGSIAILFKAVDSYFNSRRGTNYAPGTTPQCDEWDGGKVECSNGLNFCGTPAHCLGFFPDAKRYVACPVEVASIAIHPDGKYPTKVKAPRVVAPGCYEVDIFGKRIKQKVLA